MFNMCYPARITEDPAGKDWTVKFRDLAGSNTGGATEAEALDEAADCLGSYLAMLIAERKPIPEPSKAQKDERLVPVPLWIAPKLALYCALAEQGISNSELARRMGVRETIVRRMLDPDQATKPARLDRALRLVGKKILVAVAAA
jgi:antitoxin HicB